MEIPADDGDTVHRKPILEHGGIDASEVDGMTKVALIEVTEAWVHSAQASPDPWPYQKERRGRAMVSSFAGVFRDAAAEFRENESQDTPVRPVALERLLEVAEGFRHPRQQGVMLVQLVDMRVETAHGDVKHACLESATEESGHRLEGVHIAGETA